MLKLEPTFTTLGRMIVEHEIQLEDSAFELEAGEVVYFDPFNNEWVTLGGR